MLIYILAWLQAILDERNRPFENTDIWYQYTSILICSSILVC
jgi:hypothetical protein